MDSGPLEPAQSEVAESPRWGSKLREARERSGVPLREIAAELHLDVSMLEALEAEDLSKLPSASFVKGYLRSYARLLDLSADELVEAYDSAHGETSPSLQRIGKVQQMNSRDAGPRYATWGVVAVVVISVLVWWSSKILSNGVTERGSKESGVVLPMGEAETLPGLEADVEVEGESISVAPLLVPQRSAASPPASNGAVEVPGSVAMPTAAEHLVAAQQADEQEALAVAAVEPLSVLTLEFSEDVWVEISDGREKRLFFDLGRQGQTRQVEGVKPFKILFGNAPGVTLMVDGQVFDHSAFQRRNGSAKFTLSD